MNQKMQGPDNEDADMLYIRILTLNSIQKQVPTRKGEILKKYRCMCFMRK